MVANTFRQAPNADAIASATARTERKSRAQLDTRLNPTLFVVQIGPMMSKLTDLGKESKDRIRTNDRDITRGPEGLTQVIDRRSVLRMNAQR